MWGYPHDHTPLPFAWASPFALPGGVQNATSKRFKIFNNIILLAVWEYGKSQRKGSKSQSNKGRRKEPMKGTDKGTKAKYLLIPKKKN
jgi:hypothetical protein